MASSLQDQEKGESTSTSALLMDEEDTGLLSSCEEALQNDLILKNICGFLPLSDLKECRLVNPQWKGACQVSCVKKCKAIEFFGGIFVGSGAREMHGIEEMPDLIQLINSSGNAFPCKSFVLECSIRDVVNPEEETILVNFFRAIAPIAETLWIDEIEARLLNGNPAQLHFASLKSLKLTEVCFSSHENNLKFCRNIIQNSPQLAKLELIFKNSETASKLITALETGQGYKISDLHLFGPLNDTLFNLMTGIGLKLRSLLLWFYEESILSEDGQSLRNFLSNQSNSLEMLHLHFGQKVKLRITFPVMKKLTQLQFEIWSDSEIILSPISYAERFPVLQSLSIVSIPERDLDSLFDFRIGPLDTVTTLKLPLVLENPALIWQAARIFPNVRKLKVPSRERIVTSVYEAWQKVEDLTIESVIDSDSASADKVLTTYARSNHGLSQRSLDERDFQPVEFLHNLKVLRLNHRYSFAITDQACRLVLLKLRSLRRLELGARSSEKISKEVLQEMRDKFSVILLTERVYL